MKAVLHLLAIALLLAAAPAISEEIRGKVTSVSGTTVQVRIAGDLAPIAGDSVSLSFEAPGIGAIPLQGSWRVQSVSGDLVTATAQGAVSGTPQAGYDAVITSPSPKKVAAAPAPPPQRPAPMPSVPAPPPAAPPAPPANAPADPRTQRPVDMLDYYLRLSADPQRATEAADLFTEPARYFDHTRSHAEILADIAQYVVEWPERRYWVNRNEYRETRLSGNRWKLTYTLRFTTGNRAKGEKRSGTVPMEMLLKPANGQWQIQSLQSVGKAKIHKEPYP